jgi:predicted outer membrane repeat protein
MLKNWLRGLDGRRLEVVNGGRVRARRRFEAQTIEPLEERSLLSLPPIIVTSLANSGPGTLRAAMTQAQTQPGSTILLQVGGAINIGSPLPDISAQNTSIYGPGPGSLIVNRASLLPFRMFKVDSGVTAVIGGITISGGDATDGAAVENDGNLGFYNNYVLNNTTYSYPLAPSLPPMGGAVANFGTMAITDSVIASNVALSNPIPFSPAINGGGVANYGSMTISHTTVANNTVLGGDGGGVENGSSANMAVANSTFAGNTASFGQGGGLNNEGLLNLVSSTVSGNKASSLGGGIANNGVLNVLISTIASNTATAGNGGGIGNVTVKATISGLINTINVTIANNQACGSGGGLYSSKASPVLKTGPILLENTLIAGNTKKGLLKTSRSDVTGAIYPSSSFNLIGDGTGMTGLSNGGSNLIGSSWFPIDAKLGPLGNYGGPTSTIPLLPTSPAIAQGSDLLAASAGLTTDQRGLPLYGPGIGTADIGAFKTQYLVLPVTIAAVKKHH